MSGRYSASDSIIHADFLTVTALPRSSRSRSLTIHLAISPRGSRLQRRGRSSWRRSKLKRSVWRLGSESRGKSTFQRILYVRLIADLPRDAKLLSFGDEEEGEEAIQFKKKAIFRTDREHVYRLVSNLAVLLTIV